MSTPIKQKPGQLEIETTFMTRMLLLVCLALVVACINTRLNLLYIVLSLLLALVILAFVIPPLLLQAFRLGVQMTQSGPGKRNIQISYTFHYHMKFIKTVFHVFGLEKYLFTQERIFDEVYGVNNVSRLNNISINSLQLLPFQSSTEHSPGVLLKRLHFSRRGLYQISLTEICFQLFPGLFTWKISFDQQYKFSIIPDITEIKSDDLNMMLLNNISKNHLVDSALGKKISRHGTDDFLRVREYSSGDPVNWIHWKKSSFNENLIVKLLGSRINSSIHIILDMSIERFHGLYSWSNLEAVVRLAGNLARTFCESGMRVCLHMGTHVPALECSSLKSFSRITQALACVGLQQPGEFEQLLRKKEIPASDQVCILMMTGSEKLIEMASKKFRQVTIFCYQEKDGIVDNNQVENVLNDSLDLGDISLSTRSSWVRDFAGKNKTVYEKAVSRLDPAQVRYLEFPFYRLTKPKNESSGSGLGFRLLSNGRLHLSMEM